MGYQIHVDEPRLVKVEKFAIISKPDLKRASYHWRCRRCQLSQLDYTAVKRSSQIPPTDVDQTHPYNETTHKSSWCVQKSPIRPICIRRWTTTFPRRYSTLISIHLTGLHNSRSSTLPPSPVPLIITPLQGPWSKNCHFTSRRHPIRCFLTTRTSGALGNKLQYIIRLPWPCRLPWQLDQCQSQPRYNTPINSKGTWWRLHWRTTRYCNSWTALAQRHCFGKTGSSPCRQSGSSISPWLYHMWYEWTMSFTWETATPKPPTYIILPLLLSSFTRRVARSIHRHQSSTQKNAHPWRWTGISPF